MRLMKNIQLQISIPTPKMKAKISSPLFLLLIIITLTTLSSPCTAPTPYSYNSICYQECPWNNTLITYKTQGGTACLLNCTTGSYADDATKSCVTTCPQSPILTYYDNTYNRCVFNCSTNPSTFANAARVCVANCPSPLFGDELLGICVTNCSISTFYQVSGSIRRCSRLCYPNFYADHTRTCVGATNCPSFPVTYYGDDSTAFCVTRCPVARGTFADNSTRKCVLYCPLGTFADSISQMCVSLCPRIPPYFGSNITRNCLLTCNEGQFSDPATSQCTLICTAGRYGDYSTRKCVDICPLTNLTFGNPISSLCVTICPATYYADNATRKCVLAINCNISTYGDPVTQKCVKVKCRLSGILECSNGLYVDLSLALCVSRCSNWGNPLSGICQDVCPWNLPVFKYFKDSSTKLCVKTCPLNPRTFGDEVTRNCQPTCTEGYYGQPVSTLCVRTCPNNFYSNEETNICVANCTQNTSSILYFFSRNLTCLSSCPLNFFANNATLTCVSLCTNYTFGHIVTRQCLSTCPNGWFGDNSSKLCLRTCPPFVGQYADDSTNLCVSTCPSNPDYYGQDIQDGNLKCVATCTVTGFFADPLTRTCVYSCNVTSGYYGDPNDWRCYSRCPTGYGNPLSAQCVVRCPSVPKLFFADNQTKTCVLTCPNQTYGDSFLNMCVRALHCSNSYIADDASGLCVQHCSQILDLYADPIIGYCVPVCTFPYFSDFNDQKCKQTCSALLFKDNSTLKCVSVCPTLPVLYGDSSSGFCQYNCTVGYGHVNGNRRVCVLVCPSTPPLLADMVNKICVSQCPNGTFSFINNTFRGCLDYCPPQVFNATLTVNLFQDNTTWTCISVCPYGYFAFTHPDDVTVRRCVLDCPMVNGSIYYFAEQSKRQCVRTCPLLYQFTYADKINFKCSLTCSRNQYKDNSTSSCTYYCPTPYFANNVTWNCSSWCQEGWFAQKINNTCVKTCPTNLFGYLKECISQCPNNTIQYNDNTSWLCVSRCPSYPDYYADNQSISCVLSCPNNFYADTFTRRCVLPINCTEPTIADPITKKCVMQCTKVPMYFLTIQTNTCGALCSDGTFAFNQTNICVDECPEPYFGVNTTTNFYCTQYCPANQYMFINITERRCLAQCPELHYRDVLTMSCVGSCPDYSYANDSNTKCALSCQPLFADDVTKTCVLVCPTGYSASSNAGDYKCQQICDYGQYSLNKVCLSGCPYPYYADNLTRSCRTTCPYDPLTYANNITRKCTFVCNATQYAFLDNLTCIATCPQGYYRQLTLLLCLAVCPQGFFSDNNTLNCVSSCAASTLPFADPGSKFCVQKCPQDPDLFGHSNQCLTQCPLGFFAENFTRTCVSICPNVTTLILNASWADSLTRRCLSKCSALSYSFTNTAHNLCMNICPDGFYASIQIQSCVSSCPSLTYAFNGTKTCIQQCPSGQYADLVNNICVLNCTYNSSLYADSSSASCVDQCPEYPDFYADPLSKSCLLVCPNSYYAYNVTRTCVQNCPSPYFADPFSLQCVVRCVQVYLSFADSIQRKCKGSCVNHTINGILRQYYQDNATMSCVLQCPQSPSKYYGQNSTNICMQSCPTNSYGDNDTRICMDECIFQTPKFTWKDKLNNFCVTICPYGYYADNITRSCQLTCSIGYNADTSTRRCVVNCPINPLSYSVLQGGVGVCVYNCPDGTFSSEISSSCVSTCPTSPSIYYMYPPTNACVRQCIYPYYANLQTNACVMSCNVGFYGNLTTKICEICQAQCVTCQGYLVCTSCITGFYLYEITCVLNCPSYPTLYFAHKQASMCYLNCPSPFFGQVSTGLCQLICPSLKYANMATRICTSCPTGCLLCDTVGCTSCSSGYTFLPPALICNKNCNATAKFYYLSLCYSSCPNGTYLSFDLINCLKCSNPCATCFNSPGNCTSCLDSYFYLGQCLNACPSNFYINENLNCISCTVNPQRCILAPLTYTIQPFTANFILQSYVIFNRAVNMSISDFNKNVRIQYNRQSLKANQYTASVHNSTTFLVRFLNGGSLNQNSISFSFAPGSISDQFGNILTTVTVEQSITIITGLTPQIASTSVQISKSTDIVSIIFLIIIGMLLVKGGYAVLISLEILQLMHLHIFLYTIQLPYLQYVFLDTLKYFNFMFLPALFPNLGITNTYYSLFTQDISFLTNSPLIIILLAVLFLYLVVSFLSSKRFITNKFIRKLFKKIRKNRMKYSIIHDAFWVTYPYAILISLLQFKFGSFNGTLNIVNIFLAIITFLLYVVFALFVFYLGKKYSLTPQKIPKKYNFIMLEPSFTLEMPLRYLRKTIFAAALLLPSLQSQAVAILAINIVFLFIFFFYQPSKNRITNYVCLSVEILLIILTGLFIAYDKILLKSIERQVGFSIGMLIVQASIVLILIVWSIYRLALVIKDTETWQKIHAKVTENKSPEFLREQQRKRDLEFDFGSLQNRSQDERTDNPAEKVTKKSVIDQKFNIFGQDPHEEEDFQLQKPLQQKKKSERPSSMQSSEKLVLKSNSSSSKLFEPNRSANNYNKKKHLKIHQKQMNQTIQEIKLTAQAEERSSHNILMPSNQKKERVLWEDIDFDQNQI